MSRGIDRHRRAGELGWLAAIVAVGAAVRLIGYGSPRTPRWYFALTAVTSAHEALARGGLFHRWAALLVRTDASWPHESAVVMPVDTLLQAIVGPSFGLPQLGGTLWALGAIVLAWALGRRLHSPRFGLLFAALIAASPLQIAWARLGGIQIPAVTHVLLVAWLAYVAGRRGSMPALLGMALALVATLYHYYAARIAIPLAPIAVVAGIVQRPAAGVARWRTAALACLLLALGVAAVRWGDVWPRYPGYLGNTGVTDPLEIARDAVANVEREAPAVTRTYFWRGRAYGIAGGAAIGSNAPPWSLDIDAGGLCLAPVAVLGVLGLAVALRRWRRDFVCLALVVTGALVPLLSVATARRLLLFDLGWCAAAALAATTLVNAVPRPGGRRVATALTLAAALGLALYAGAVIVRLGDRLPAVHGAIIPFAESGFGDGITCVGCIERAYRWQDEIERGAFVVLFDTDENRENRTSPGGLRLYGQIAAMAAGRPAAFVDYYGLARNWDPDPPRFGPLYDDTGSDAVTELIRRVRAVTPARIVWHFAQPTAWERVLGDRLVAAGGVRRPADAAPLGAGERRSPDPGFEVVTPWPRRAKALHRLASFVQPPATPRALRVVIEAVRGVDTPPTVVASGPAAAANPRVVPPYATWQAVTVGGRVVPLGATVALAARDTALQAMDRSGREFVIDGLDEPRPAGGLPRRVPVGPACAALGGRWWIADPIAGTLESADGAATPRGSTIVGVATLDDTERVVVAAADQMLRIEDGPSGAAYAAFPAYVPPSRQSALGECTPVLAGASWIATFDDLRDMLAVYAHDGRPLGVLRLDQILDVPRRTMVALGTSGARLLVGTNAARLFVIRLDVLPTNASTHQTSVGRVYRQTRRAPRPRTLHAAPAKP